MNEKQGKDGATGDAEREPAEGTAQKKPGDAARKMRAMFHGKGSAGEARTAAPRGSGTRAAPAE